MRRLRKGIVAATLAVAMLLTGTTQPARADDGAADSVVDLALLAWNVYKAGTITPDQAVQFVRLLTGAVSEMENEVVNHIDDLQARDVMRDLRDVRMDLADYQAARDDEDWVELYIRLSLTGFAANAYEKYYAVGNDKAKDQIALAGQGLYSTLLALTTDAGLTSAKAIAQRDFRKLLGDIVRDLEPKCRSISPPDNPPGTINVLHECTAANGETASKLDLYSGGTWHSGPVDLNDLKARAAKNSAWLAAKHTLDELGQ